mmetsp:Transcript_15519/g.35497  ORF Transcript_15519/g.35497 Transcript_15519/m.35497 type:complete len:220 (+) Transcript_15519:320-979(+)
MHLRSLCLRAREHFLQCLRAAGCCHEPIEWRRRQSGSGFVLGMKLHSKIEWVLRLWKLYNVHALLHLILPCKEQPLVLHGLLVGSVEFVAVSMSFLDLAWSTIEGTAKRLLWSRELDPSSTQPHVAAHCVLGDFWHKLEDVVLGLLLPIELLTCGISVAKHISGKLNESYLHSKAYAQVWFFPDSGEMRSVRLSIDASISKSTRNQNPIAFAQLFLSLG